MRERKPKKDRWWLLPLLAVALAAFLNLFILINAHVPSGSMEPTIPTGALLVGDRTAYLRGEPQAGDVALFRHESEFGRDIIVKRIIALPGQTFSMENGRVYLDGELLDEPYITEFSADSYPETVVPEGCYLVLGDNRRDSHDSRFWADPFVRREELLARALLVYFPRPHLL
ncbi:MAG: signal peptidase I [Clostridiales bacterium]|nr:signal peptidase I [Clostridiales bacterium]